MKVWITCFIVLFGAAELLQWFEQFTLPMPIFMLGGFFLAVASNYDKLRDMPFHLDYEARSPQPKSTEPIKATPTPQSLPLQPDPFTQLVQPSKPISFTIRKPYQARD